jgi:hypothetical protein
MTAHDRAPYPRRTGVARYAGAPQKYNATVSRAWVELVGHRDRPLNMVWYDPEQRDLLRDMPGTGQEPPSASCMLS